MDRFALRYRARKFMSEQFSLKHKVVYVVFAQVLFLISSILLMKWVKRHNPRVFISG